MKCFSLLILLFVPMAVFASNPPMDTLIVHADTACNNFMPGRMHYAVASKSGGSSEYEDSIRVCSTIIDAYNKDYYLIVYDQDSVKRMEGYFHDQYAQGHCVHYDFKGRKTSEGEYTIIRKRRYTHSRKTGLWKYFNANGDLIRQEKNR